jgi:chemotaxis protein MotC
MLRAALGLALLTFPRPAVAEPEAAPSGDAGPIEMVRTLRLLQDRIAQGSVAAHAGQAHLMARIEATMLRADAGTWADRRRVHAAVTFALSGGGPAILRRVSAAGTAPEPEATLVRGALAYVEGREAEAGGLLRDVDARTLPPSLAGPVSLMQAALSAKTDAAGSIVLLDRARLLSPGTLVEESAIRREIFVVSQVRDLQKLETLAIQYLRRFPHSVYAGNFRERFASILTKLDLGRDETHFAMLARILDEIAPRARRDLYMLVAGTAIQDGKMVAGFWAAEQARALSTPATAEAARAALYRGAAEVVSLPTIDDGLSRLKALDRALLPAADVRLLDAALSAAAQIRHDPGAARPSETSRPASTQREEPPPGSAGASDTLILQAQATIGRIDALVPRP